MASINKQNILGTVIQKRHNHIFGFMKILSKYLDILNCVFTMNSSTEKKIVFWSFIGQDFIRRLFKFFWTTNMHILFFWLNICIFTPVQTKKIAFGRKMSKIYPFIFYIFSLSNWQYSPKVQWVHTKFFCFLNKYMQPRKLFHDLNSQ